jgi:hypothetical protein
LARGGVEPEGEEVGAAAVSVVAAAAAVAADGRDEETSRLRLHNTPLRIVCILDTL